MRLMLFNDPFLGGQTLIIRLQRYDGVGLPVVLVENAWPLKEKHENVSGCAQLGLPFQDVDSMPVRGSQFMLQKPQTGGLAFPMESMRIRPGEKGSTAGTRPLRPAISALVLGLAMFVIGGKILAFGSQIADDGGCLNRRKVERRNQILHDRRREVNEMRHGRWMAMPVAMSVSGVLLRFDHSYFQPC
jgi:hypothetical protein